MDVSIRKVVFGLAGAFPTHTNADLVPGEAGVRHAMLGLAVGVATRTDVDTGCPEASVR